MSANHHNGPGLALPPGSYGLPWLGETIAWRRDPLKFLRDRYQRYGRIFKSSIYGRHEITMLGPEANEFILSTHRDHFEWAGGYELFMDRRLFSTNLFLQDGPAHDRHRQIILPAFHGKALRSYFDAMTELSHAHARRWAEQGRIVAFAELRKLTFDIAARLLLGANTSEEVGRLSQLFDTLAKGTQAFPPWDLPWTKYGRARRAVASLREYFQARLAERRKEPGADVLGMLVAATDEDGKPLSEQEMISHVMMIVLAAHDTTTSSMTWLLFELDRCPEIKLRLRDELEKVTRSQPLAVEHLSQLSYLDQVLKEVERRHSVLTGLPRKVVKSFDFDGYHVPVGATVYYSILFTHMMPELFRDPERFDPDRFSPTRREDDRTRFSLIGFGGGARRCIGQGFARMEMKILTAILLEGYDWSVLPDQNLRPRYLPTNRPQDGLRIRFEKKE
ncbi:MAG TPA: cytochrome P450 [Candidatus Acidoferrales bacterium]|nr:cytochrome P450 [Candidatus Acidoferrales bacterium]